MWLLSIAQMLTVMATGAQPSLPAGQAPGNLPDPIPTRQTHFVIPFEIDQVDHPALGAAEIQLWLSRDRGGTWQHETSVAPTAKHFVFRAPADGEYWFAVRTRDRSGNFRPPMINGPGLRVVVDTQAPVLSIEAQRGQAGQIVATWKIDEQNVNPQTFKLQYRVEGSQQWEDVAVDASKIRSNTSTNSGESTWWAPAGQGRIEIRAEISDTAGNPNVSHAQVTTVASAAQSSDVNAWSSPNTAPAPVQNNNWQASSGQNTAGQDPWSQPNAHSAGQGHSDPSAQTPNTNSWSRDPYQQNNGYGTGQMANDPAASSGYGSGSGSSSAPSGNLGYGREPSGSFDNRYGTDYGMASQRPQSSAIPSSKVYESPGYDQYAQAQPSSPQQASPYEQYGSQADYGSREASDPYQNRSRDSNYPYNNRSGMGTVAAQPSPAYQSQYKPENTANGTERRYSGGTSDTTAGYSTSYRKPDSATQRTRTVNAKLFEIEYSNPPQTMAVGRVELWGTRDGGATWQSFGYDSDNRSPMQARVPDEGTYGFNIVFHPMHGQPAQSPQRGQRPDMVIRVDLTRPNVRVVGVEPSRDELTIRWQATDVELANTPISLSYADAATGQWRTIAQNLQNTGSYRWPLPLGLPPEVQIRIEARDAAGNTAAAETRNPVRLARQSEPPTSPRPYSVEVQNVKPLGQSDQPNPRRYLIR